MSEKNRRTVLVIILILAVVWAGYNYPFGPKGKNEEALSSPGQTQQSQAQALHPSATPLALDTLPEVSKAELARRAAQPWPRDPFYRRPARSVNQQKQAKRSYKLKAIIYNEIAPSAFLNGRVVRQGDLIGGATVTKISPNSVTLRIGQKYQKITLK